MAPHRTGNPPVMIGNVHCAAIVRDMEKDGRDEEIQQISRSISQVAPELPGKSAKEMRDRANPENGNS